MRDSHPRALLKARFNKQTIITAGDLVGSLRRIRPAASRLVGGSYKRMLSVESIMKYALFYYFCDVELKSS